MGANTTSHGVWKMVREPEDKVICEVLRGDCALKVTEGEQKKSSCDSCARASVDGGRLEHPHPVD